MHIISRKALPDFWERQPESEGPLTRWYTIVKKTDFKDPLLTIRGEQDYAAAVERLGLLPELGGAGSVRAVLAGERELRAGEIRVLAERFHVSPAVFL